MSFSIWSDNLFPFVALYFELEGELQGDFIRAVNFDRELEKFLYKPTYYLSNPDDVLPGIPFVVVDDDIELMLIFLILIDLVHIHVLPHHLLAHVQQGNVYGYALASQ